MKSFADEVRTAVKAYMKAERIKGASRLWQRMGYIGSLSTMKRFLAGLTVNDAFIQQCLKFVNENPVPAWLVAPSLSYGYIFRNNNQNAIDPESGLSILHRAGAWRGGSLDGVTRLIQLDAAVTLDPAGRLPSQVARQYAANPDVIDMLERYEKTKPVEKPTWVPERKKGDYDNFWSY